jgi:hypothetical protein
VAQHLRTTLCFGISLIWAAWTAGVAQADPPQYCRDLAMQYATAPDQLVANALAALRDCEMAASQEQQDTPSPAAPPAEQSNSPGATPIDQPGWGQWSPPVPWSDDRGKTKSWGDQ